ncbi:metalloprotease [Rhodotorula kratochvilovae]
MTITDPNYRPDAPSAFVTQPGNALDHLGPGWTRVEAKGDLPAYGYFTKELERSQNDDREYRIIMLENGLEAVIISDPKTDKAAAAMDVQVGHLSDPEDIPGLAHFCEHLMFMGTEKYPAETDYSEFLTQHSGSSNAFTGMDQTNYYFDVAPEHLAPALDRFAQFFISPLFDPSCTDREANAVHSENSKNLQSDMWRLYQLDKSTSSRQHAFWRFGTGDRKTLWDTPRERGIDVRQRLIEWCEKYYSANVCKLAVVTKDSLDATTEVVVSQFSSVPNRVVTPPTFPGSPLTAAELGKTTFVKTVKDTRMLELSFPWEDEAELYASKPGSFLSHLVGHEGKGSVLSYLKARGWANGMSAGAGNNGASGFDFFKVNVDLTKEGLEHYEEVASVIFAYIALLRAHPPAEWAFLEVAQLSQLAFRFKEKSPAASTVSGLSQMMGRPFPRDKVLSAPYICSEFYPAKIVQMLEQMTPQNCRITLASKTEVGGRTYAEREEWYGTEYTIEPMTEKILASGKNAAEYPELALPEPNALIPQDLTVKTKVKAEVPARRPLNLRNSPISRVWHKQDDRWLIPRAGAFFLFRSPHIDASPLASVQTRMFTELIRDSLQEYSYEADLAGLSYSFDQAADGILLSLDGYNDKLPMLVDVIVKRMKEYKVDEKRFGLVHDQLVRLYENFRLEQPFQHVGVDAAHLTTAVSYLLEDKLAALTEVTPANVQAHAARVLGRMHIESLVHGNMTREEALALAKSVEETFKPQPLSVEELKSRQALVVPPGQWLARRPVSNPLDANTAVEQFTYVGDLYDDELRARLSVFGTMMREPLFDDLRGKQQLGYIVSSGARKSIAFMGLRVIVQSERDGPFVESRINAFWDDFRVKLDEMSEEEFDKYKQTVINRKTEDHKAMWQESSALWVDIHTGWYDFEQRWRDAETIKKLTKADIVAFFAKYFFPSPDRPLHRLSVHLDSQRLTPEALAELGPPLAHLGIEPDPVLMEELAKSRPTVDAAKEAAEKLLREHGRPDEEVAFLLGEVEELRTLPVPEGYTVIEDREQWRMEREKAPHAYPIAEYSDLFPAKL